MRIHEILPGVAEGSKAIADWPFIPTRNSRDFHTELSPYGDNWDILWIGHCGSYLDGSGRVYKVNDTTVPPPEKEWAIAGHPNSEQHPKGTRVVFEMTWTTCCTAYAMSNQGAHKMIEFLAHSDDPIDLKMSALCKNEASLACLSVWPQVITNSPSESNMKQTHDDVVGPHPHPHLEPNVSNVSAGLALQYSARRNAPIVQQGLGRDQWIKEF
jgi:hypothetical protein